MNYHLITNFLDKESLLNYLFLYVYIAENLSSLVTCNLISLSKKKWLQHDIRESDNINDLHPIIYETLRLHTPHVITCIKNKNPINLQYENNNYEIPDNSQILLSPWLYNRDETIWNDALEWKPDRYHDGCDQYSKIYNLFD
eukprot:UN29820